MLTTKHLAKQCLPPSIFNLRDGGRFKKFEGSVVITITVMKGHLMKKVFIISWPKMGGPVGPFGLSVSVGPAFYLAVG